MPEGASSGLITDVLITDYFVRRPRACHLADGSPLTQLF
jgi:hypothetical protein